VQLFSSGRVKHRKFLQNCSYFKGNLPIFRVSAEIPAILHLFRGDLQNWPKIPALLQVFWKNGKLSGFLAAEMEDRYSPTRPPLQEVQVG
jgi:hypothetical protein